MQKPLNGEAGSSILVTSENLNVTDSDSPEESITYRLVHSPTNGHLICVRDGHSIVINRGKRFTQKELLSGKVLFQHDKEKPLKGKLNDFKTSIYSLLCVTVMKYCFKETFGKS